MFKKKLSEWSMLPAEVEVTHFYGMADSHAADFGFRIAWSISVAELAEQRVGLVIICKRPSEKRRST